MSNFVFSDFFLKTGLLYVLFRISTYKGGLTQEKPIFGIGTLGPLQDDNALLLLIYKQFR